MRTFNRTARRIAHRQWAVAGFMWSTAAFADQTWIPYASLRLEHNSNVFALSGREQAFDLSGDSTIADTLQRYIVGVDTNLTQGSQTLSLGLEGRHLDFNHFSDLDHNEYLAKAHLTIQMSQSLNSTIDYRQERRMAAFIDRYSTALTIENERTGSARINLMLDTKLRLETGLQLHELESPLPDFPDFGLKEKSVDIAIKYLGVDALTTGVYISYLEGRFNGIPDNGKFHQQSISLTADYSKSDMSSAGAQFGYTLRQNDLNSDEKTVALTGLLKYRRELTGKTSIDVQAFRRLDSYIGGESSVEATGADVKVSWRITEKTALNGDYQWSHNRFTPSGLSSPDQNRKDDERIASIWLTYQTLPWLSLRPYCSYQIRDSNIDINSFRATITGFDVQARFQ